MEAPTAASAALPPPSKGPGLPGTGDSSREVRPGQGSRGSSPKQQWGPCGAGLPHARARSCHLGKPCGCKVPPA